MKKQLFMLDEEGINHLVEQITERLRSTSKIPKNFNDEELLTIKGAASLIKLSKATLYGLVHRKEIPYSKKAGRLYFLKSELMEWIASGKKTSKKALDKKVDDYLFKNRI